MSRHLKSVTATCCMCGIVFSYETKYPSGPLKRNCSKTCYRANVSARMANTNRRHASARMKTNNPMHRDDNLERMRSTLKAMGHAPRVRRGNGHGATEAESAIATALGWPTNVVVATRMPRDSGYPTNYKLDVGNSELKIGIEVDGPSHCALKRREQDRKKEDFLRGLGWIVLRVSNRQALEETSSTISRLREAIHTLRMKPYSTIVITRRALATPRRSTGSGLRRCSG